MSKFVPIHEAAKFLGVSTQTLRRWENEGLKPHYIAYNVNHEQVAVQIL